MRCATPLKDEERAEEIVVAQEKSFHHVTHDLVREVTSPNSTVRKQAMHSLQVLAQVTGKSVTVIMEPHKEVGSDTARRCACVPTAVDENRKKAAFLGA